MIPLGSKASRKFGLVGAPVRKWLSYRLILSGLVGGTRLFASEPTNPLAPALPPPPSAPRAVPIAPTKTSTPDESKAEIEPPKSAEDKSTTSDSLRPPTDEGGPKVPATEAQPEPAVPTDPEVNSLPLPSLGTDALGSLLPTFSNSLPRWLGSGFGTDGMTELRWGSVTAHPALGYGFTYSTGLRSSLGQTESTYVHTVTPSIGFDFGRNWRVEYTPSLVFYGSGGFRDAVNQSVQFQGHTRRGEWNLSLNNGFIESDNTLIETGRQTQQTANNTRIGANRQLTPVLSLELGALQSLRWTTEFNRTFSWSTSDTLNYRINRNVSFGLVAGLGYDRIEPGVDMTSERLQGRLQGLVGQKLTYSLSGGLEFRQFKRPGSPTLLSPVISGNVGYQLTTTTRLNLVLQQEVSPSYFDGQFTESVSASGVLNQRLFRYFNLALNGRYEITDRNGTADPTQRQASYTYNSVRATLSTTFLRRGSVSIFYGWSKNSSAIQAVSFLSQQVGLHISYRF